MTKSRFNEKFRVLAVRNPSTHHRWVLAGEYAERADSMKMNEHDRQKVIKHHVDEAELDKIWLLHRRTQPYHFEMIVAPKRKKLP